VVGGGYAFDDAQRLLGNLKVELTARCCCAGSVAVVLLAVRERGGESSEAPAAAAPAVRAVA